MHVYLIRHAQKEMRAGDPGLTKLGIEQAKQTGLFLSQFPINKIISSPFQRTLQTAELIAEQLSLEYELNDSLVERMNWNHKSIKRDDFIKEWIKATHDRDYVSPYGGSSVATGKRLEQLIKRHLNQTKQLVLITHGGAIADYLRNVFGDQALTPLIREYKDGFDYQVPNCSINKILVGDDPKIELLNYVKHLSDSTE